MFTNKIYVGFISAVTDFDSNTIYSKKIRPTILYRKNNQKFVDVLSAKMEQFPYDPSKLNIGDEFVNLKTLVSINEHIIEFNEQNNTSINLGFCSTKKKLVKTFAEMGRFTASKNC